ncbi:MAG: glycosyltransferase [Verrucomicrobia bacterium]|nr:glycosyltransferase [Verrucomicrobiota bacterium]
MPCRVLNFITELNIGGAERLLAEVLPRLDRAKVEPQVACLHGAAPLAAALEKAGIRVHHLRSSQKFDPRPAWRLARLLEQERIEVLHTHLIQADILGYAAGRLARTPAVVSTKHNVRYYERQDHRLRPVARWVEKRMDALVAVSSAVAAEYGHARRLWVIHNGVDCKKFSPLPLPSHGPVVCVANFTMQKGHRILLEAVARLVPEFPGLQVELAGGGPMRDDLQARAGRLGLANRVAFLNTVQDVRPVLARASMFVLPALWEGLGLAALEAMAMGRPVIVTDVDGLREIVTHERDGLVVQSGDVGALSEAIARLLRDRALAQQLADAARARVAEDFSLERMAWRLEDFYESLAKKS